MNEPPDAEVFLFLGAMKTPQLYATDTNDVSEVTTVAARTI